MTPPRARTATTYGLAAAAGLVVLSVVWGRRLQQRTPEIKLGAAPFVGRDERDGWDWRAHWQLAIPIAIACTVVVAGPYVIARWRLRWVTLASGLTAGAFAVALASCDGVDGLFHGATDETEYYANLARTREWRTFLDTFIERQPYYTVHVRGHPPGFTLVLKVTAGIGLHGAWPVVALSIIGVVTTPMAVLVAVHRLAGAHWARRAAPFLAIAPYAIWQVTSADAFISAVTSASVAALAVALTAPRAPAALASVIGGLLIGCALFLTYGTVAFAIVPLAIAASMWRQWQRMTLVLAVVTTAVIAVVLAFGLSGFSWIEGFSEVRKQYWAGTAKFRTWTYFAVSNIAVVAIVVGPAVIAGIARLRDRRVWILVGATLAAVTAAELSQYSKGEVERIWLLFYPWLTLGAAPLATAATNNHSTATLRAWLTIQAGLAITLQSWLLTKW